MVICITFFIFVFFLISEYRFLVLDPKTDLFFASMNSSMYREAPDHKFKAFEIIFSTISNWTCNPITSMSRDTNHNMSKFENFNFCEANSITWMKWALVGNFKEFLTESWNQAACVKEQHHNRWEVDSASSLHRTQV